MNDDQDQQQETFEDSLLGIILAMVAASFVLVIVIGVTVDAVMGDRPDPEFAALTEARIAPVGQVLIATEQEMAELGAATSGDVGGEKIYMSACFACHATGVADAPKYGVNQEWTERIAQGVEVLYDHSINGFNAMTPKGGFINLSDDDVRAAVDYMVSGVQ